MSAPTDSSSIMSHALAAGVSTETPRSPSLASTHRSVGVLEVLGPVLRTDPLNL
jgi:hypothetical protein